MKFCVSCGNPLVYRPWTEGDGTMQLCCSAASCSHVHFLDPKVAAGVVAILVALVSEGFTAALFVGVAVLAVQQFEGNVVAPVLVGRQVSLHPMVVILSVTTGAIVWGVLGAAIAVPIVAVTTGLVEYMHTRPREPGADVEGAVEGEAPAGGP